MRQQKKWIWFFFSVFQVWFLQRKALHGLNNGYYLQKDTGNVSRKVYADVTEDSITLFPLKAPHSKQVDEDAGIIYPLKNNIPSSASIGILVKNSIDIDLTSVLFKYRFSTRALPNQLSEYFNAALYAGVRKDYFRFRNHRTPISTKPVHTNHFGVDAGLFAGLGTTPINASVTENNVTAEYDGFIFQKGMAVFIGIQNLTIGASLGWDRLLDKYNTYWIYREKPWLGIIIGLKLSD